MGAELLVDYTGVVVVEVEVVLVMELLVKVGVVIGGNLVLMALVAVEEVAQTLKTLVLELQVLYH